MKFGSLFAGIGGFGLGFERAGMECAWQVEYDPYPMQVLESHWPNVTRYEDVNDVGKRNLEPVGLISGGFPCQDVSVAGNRKGLAGKRSGLWFEFHRILEETRPEWVVIENVPGLLSSNGGRDFAAILRGLVELRYGVAWRILDAQHFGVAQRRRRVFIVGHLGDGRAAEVLFERQSLQGDIEAGRKAGARTTAAVKASPPNQRNGGSYPIADEFVLSHALSAHPTGQRNDPNGQTFVTAIDTRNHRAQPDGKSGPPQAKSTGGQSLNYQNPIAHTLTKNYGKQPDNSDRNGGPPNILPNEYGVRRLTPTECERLQGFPDGWTEGLSDSRRYKSLGNAVCVPVVEWIGRRIVDNC